MGQRGLYTGGETDWGCLKITSISNLYEESITWQEMLFVNISSYTPDLTSMWHLQSPQSNAFLGSVANCCLSLGPDLLRRVVFVSKFLTVLFFCCFISHVDAIIMSVGGSGDSDYYSLASL